jgi:hypothetical protein
VDYYDYQTYTSIFENPKIYAGYMNAGKEKNRVGFFILEAIGGFSNGQETNL